MVHNIHVCGIHFKDDMHLIFINNKLPFCNTAEQTYYRPKQPHQLQKFPRLPYEITLFGELLD